MRRIVRPVSTTLPPSADGYTPQVAPPVVINHSAGTLVHVMTFCGVEVSCTVVGTRNVSGGIVYDVKPLGDPKVKDFQKAGAPITPENAMNQFVAFEWQISKKVHT